ncbi:acetyl-CoA synthetase-like protein [Xylariales sp. PMI_506]|nr:acetyl-CoA synthetase-like protein [Xylariales sp. PMI_506]
MTSFKTHLTVLEDSAKRYPSRTAFRVPKKVTGTFEIGSWDSISYRDVLHDVENAALYWLRALSSISVPLGSVVGLWLKGLSYLDMVNIYGLARAGYVPQMCSVSLSDPSTVDRLLQLSGARALVTDPAVDQTMLNDMLLPTFCLSNSEVYNENDLTQLPSLTSPEHGEQVIMIFHTSGTISGMPKLVPCTAAWLSACIAKENFLCQPYTESRQDVTVWIGSMCHMAQTAKLVGFLQHGSCMIQPTNLPFSADELVTMVRSCDLNRLMVFGSRLASLLKSSRADADVLSALKSQDEIYYVGLSVAPEHLAWAAEHGIKLRNCFASTEVGAMLISIGGTGVESALLKPGPVTLCEFRPCGSQNIRSEDGELVELVILPQSPDFPHPSLQSDPTQPYSTGDLFVEVASGCYLSKGRADDWIKSESSLRYDTKAIEDNVMATCGETIVAACVVVGHARPSPTLFVEAKAGTETADRWLREEIMKRIRAFHVTRYSHERIHGPEFIIVVPPGTLPRTSTKGDIRRKAVEETFKVELDRLYSC